MKALLVFAVVASIELVASQPPGLNVTSIIMSSAPASPGWSGVAKGKDGNVYAAPYASDSKVSVFNPATNQTTFINDPTTGANKYSGIALAANGKLYCAPYDAPQVLEIDPSAGTGTATEVGTGIPSSTDPSKYVGAVAVGNYVYFAPFSATNILKMDITMYTTTTISTGYSSTSGLNLFAGLTQELYAKDGNNYIYLAPYDADRVMYLDTSANVAYNLSSDMGNSTGAKFWGIVTATSGKIYTVPYNAGYILIIDPLENATATNVIVSAATNKYRGGARGVNGQIFFAPYNADKVLVIDTFTNGTSELDITTYGVADATNLNKWDGIALTNNDKLVAAPFSRSSTNWDWLIIGSIRIERFLPFAPIRITFTTDLLAGYENASATIPITFHRTPDCTSDTSRFSELTGVIWNGRSNVTLVVPLDKMLSRTSEGIVPLEEEVFFCFHVINRGRLEYASELVSPSFWITRVLPRSLVLSGAMKCSLGNSQNGIYGTNPDGTTFRCFDGVMGSELLQSESLVDNKPVTYDPTLKQFSVHSLYASSNDWGYVG